MSTIVPAPPTSRVPAKVPLANRGFAACETCQWKTPAGTYNPQLRAQDHSHNFPGHFVVVHRFDRYYVCATR
jgi:hypothetical protein